MVAGHVVLPRSIKLRIPARYPARGDRNVSRLDLPVIIVSASKTEGLPNVLIESVFFDCARVATATSGAKELINDGKDGFLVPIDDAKTLGEKIELLMRDENLRDEFVRNAALRKNSFKTDQIYQKWMDFITQNLES